MRGAGLKPDVEFKSALARILYARRVTQKALAEATGIPTRTVNAYCVGRRSPYLNRAQLMASFLCCTTDDLFPPTKK